MPNVSFVRSDLRKAIKKYSIIGDCFDGEAQVKSKKTAYLPMPNPEDQSEANYARYASYIERAVFYNVVKRTLNGLTGLLFVRTPEMVLPEDMKLLETNADGSGSTLIQVAKLASRLTVGYGRCGLFIDMPDFGRDLTRAELQDGIGIPSIKPYHPSKVINWRTVIRGGKTILSLVVLEETYVKSDDGFEVTFGKQWRVLRLVDLPVSDASTVNVPENAGTYEVQLFRDNNKQKPIQVFQPKDANGDRLNEIPFMFVGSENNTPDIDDAPMIDVATLNLGHYRNSADYEESVFIVGQPTPVFSGLTEQWVKDILKGVVRLGSRAAIPLPVNASASLLQAGANPEPLNAMKHKEAQMVAIGANLIDTSRAPRTATETMIDDTNERSVLATCGDNVSAAMRFGLGWAAKFLGSVSTDIKFALNTEFDLVRLTAQERQQLVQEWMDEAISWKEVRENLRRGGIAKLSDEDARKDIKANPPPKPEPKGATVPNPNPNSNTGG